MGAMEIGRAYHHDSPVYGLSAPLDGSLKQSLVNSPPTKQKGKRTNDVPPPDMSDIPTSPSPNRIAKAPNKSYGNPVHPDRHALSRLRTKPKSI